MLETVLSSGRDTLLVAIPAVALLLASMFRLDQMIAAPKDGGRKERAPCGVDLNGEPILTDPDGRPSRPSRLSRLRRAGTGQRTPLPPC